ncbi:SpoIIE family protein phosphatase [Streptomyces durbertensis]|uniref:SpoIIE family protein phosphatase n=1 Tax=Streptomyces durbertensis TaxID=2448886 RepID=A0ABR6EM43_9ACTN|nr:GAF domain-containing SpoIIE family protein phosphatase [Streptomyces durbertensis]MBB1246000.1 SpoIIE family protein phosphatase [Streptomyces durbertensis]
MDHDAQPERPPGASDPDRLNGGSRGLAPELPRLPRTGDAIDEIARRIQELANAKDRLQGLLRAVMAISGEQLELPAVLRRIVTTAMELVHARYGALGVLTEDGTRLAQFIPVGLTEEERAALAGVELPHGRGLLGHLIHEPGPLRVEGIPEHSASVGFPAGHPPMRNLLGVAITVRGEVYGDLYLCDREDGQPFDSHDEDIVVALAAAAGVAIENARLFDNVRNSAEQFQRLLLPSLPDLHPYEGAAVYRPATAPGQLGGDWFDAIMLPDDACAAVIGDVVGHDLQAAAAMAQTRNMLRALLFDRRTPPSAVLTQLDHTLHAITDNPVTTACLARIEPSDGRWWFSWSSAGHAPPLLVTADGRTEYLEADPGLPLGVDTDIPRPDHRRELQPGSTVLMFTDGLVEDVKRPIDAGMAELAELAGANSRLPLEKLCRLLADHHPSDGHDDIALLALRMPPGAN